MDQRERMDERQEALLAALDGRQAAIWTCLPGIIESYDHLAQTAKVQPAVQGVIVGKDGVAQLVNLPLLLDCPVQFPSGGGASMTFPIEKGDEGVIYFSARCIDAWWQSGGVQPPAEMRMHDLSDGFVFVGVRSRPRRLANVSVRAVQVRSDDGSTFVELDPDAQTLVLTAPGGLTINADVTINGDVEQDGDAHSTGTITADVDVIADGISGKSHKHGGVQAGGSQTGTPV